MSLPAFLDTDLIFFQNSFSLNSELLSFLLPLLPFSLSTGIKALLIVLGARGLFWFTLASRRLDTKAPGLVAVIAENEMIALPIRRSR